MRTRRQHFAWLLVVLLVAVLTGQAASAYAMPCRGSASCCCAMAMDMALPGPAQNCCGTAPAKPCDIEREVPPAALSYITTPLVDTGNLYLVPGAAISAAVSADSVTPSAVDTIYRRDRGHPPIYLAILTILC